MNNRKQNEETIKKILEITKDVIEKINNNINEKNSYLLLCLVTTNKGEKDNDGDEIINEYHRGNMFIYPDKDHQDILHSTLGQAVDHLQDLHDENCKLHSVKNLSQLN